VSETGPVVKTRTINRSLLNLEKGRRMGYGFKKGQVANPNGRPPVKSCIPDLLRAIGDKPVSDWLMADLRKKYGPDHKPNNMREAMLMSVYVDASKGDNVARVFVAERTEGKVPQAQINLNANQNTDDLTKMPLADILALAQELNT